MKVIFRHPSGVFLDAARKLTEQDSDSQFTAKNIADYLDISIDEAFYHIDRYALIDVLAPYCDTMIPDRTGDETYYFMRKWLTEGKTYEVLTINNNYYSLLNDPDAEHWSNRMAIYHESLFEVVDSQIPRFWRYLIGDEFDYDFGPPEWDSEFIDAYNDNKKEAVDQFWMDLEKYYPETYKERA